MKGEKKAINIQLVHSFVVNMRICQPEKVMFTEAKSIVLLYNVLFDLFLFYVQSQSTFL